MRIRLSTILFPTDLSEGSLQALPTATAIARRFSSRLLVCHAIDLGLAGAYGPSLLVVPPGKKELMDWAERQIRALPIDPQVKWEPLIVEGDTALAVADAAEQHDANLIVTATHGRSGLGRALLGSVTERVVHSSRRPVLAVRQSAPSADGAPPFAPRRILVGCDFSSDANHALDYALAFAQEYQSAIHLLHVIEPTLYEHIDATTGALAADLERAVAATVRERLDALVPLDAKSWCGVTAALRSGSPHTEIVRYATENAIDLVVLGFRGRGLADRMLVGCTTDRVIRRAPCPVLSVEERRAL